MIDRIRTIIAQQLNISLDKVLPTSRIIQDLGADSLDIVELLMTLEEEFGIVVSDEQAQALVTIQDISNLIENAK
ncbi:MAG: acyl carrier protein [Christensenellales bacterium]|jgi:acyl carrier protein